MLKRLTMISALTLLLAANAFPLPRAFAGGDYWLRNEHTWTDWEVTCPELSGRLASDWPLDDQEPGALLDMDWHVNKWPVVQNFSKGQHLKALPDAVGGIIIKDIDGASWMRVRVGPALSEELPAQFCFVRANARFVRPVPPEN